MASFFAAGPWEEDPELLPEMEYDDLRMDFRSQPVLVEVADGGGYCVALLRQDADFDGRSGIVPDDDCPAEWRTCDSESNVVSVQRWAEITQ